MANAVKSTLDMTDGELRDVVGTLIEKSIDLLETSSLLLRFGMSSLRTDELTTAS